MSNASFIEDKKTDWYPSVLTPAREGWYEREYPIVFLMGSRFSMDYFNGLYWQVKCGEHFLNIHRSKQCLPWRGLRINPNEQK